MSLLQSVYFKLTKEEDQIKIPRNPFLGSIFNFVMKSRDLQIQEASSMI